MQSNPKVTHIALNGNGGALTVIALTIMASKVEVMEDPTLNGGAAQGLQGYYLDPAGKGQPQPVISPAPNAPSNTWLPQTAGQRGQAFQPIVFGGADGRVNGDEGNYVGADGTPILYIKSASATATGILLTEWP